MKFFIETIFFKNRTPFELLEINLAENEIGVLSAVNGRGKTTILSHITDAFHELAKLAYPNHFEGKENKFYRVSTNLENLEQSNPSIFYIRCNHNGEKIDYLNIRGLMNENEYNDLPIENKIPYHSFGTDLQRDIVAKKWSISNNTKTIEDIFKNNIMTYFPSYRFEKPGYINEPYETKLSFRKKSTYSGIMTNPIEVISGLEPLANWIMDIVLDMQYSQTNVHMLKANLDAIITLILGGKQNKKLRIGVGPRGYNHTRLQIVEVESEKSLYPTIFSLSAGEAAALCMFGEILRQADNINSDTIINNTTGIVLIDEVDKHLHIKLQKEVLPTLFSMFPKIQFLISSHSPFLSMGLAEKQSSRSKIIDLDNFGVTKDPTTNDLYTEVYDMMIGDNTRFKDEYNALKNEILNSTKPLIITEGKTDIQHIKKAQEVLGITLDIDYYPVPGNWGDSKLKLLLEQLSKVRQHQAVIGIFDRDAPAIIDFIESDENLFKDFGNDVFGMCLPVPEERIEYTNISIEFFYKDMDLTKEKDGRRLYFDNEIMYCQPGSKQGKPKATILCEPDPTLEYNKKIFDQDVSELDSAHSKSRFAALIEGDQEFCKDINFENFRSIFQKLELILKYREGK